MSNNSCKDNFCLSIKMMKQQYIKKFQIYLLVSFVLLSVICISIFINCISYYRCEE
jgi:hypothetical protein